MQSSILEIGAGTGWQARLLSERGFRVEAIDIKIPPKRGLFWSVKTYDGKHIPFGDSSFDVVFSSNVLEHIPRAEIFQDEITRVLKPHGTAIHVLPTPTWRLWTLLSHYPYVLKLLFASLRSDEAVLSRSDQEKSSIVTALCKALWPPAHGVQGNALSEIYWFKEQRWGALFERTGWRIKRSWPSGLFYTGGAIFGGLMSVDSRKKLGRYLGSSTMIFVLEKECPFA
ncbi:MAG: class I SAM-dependent methyltransferase [Nitrososphaera sp.]